MNRKRKILQTFDVRKRFWLEKF